MTSIEDSDVMIALRSRVSDYLAGRIRELPAHSLDEVRSYFAWLKCAVQEKDSYITALERELQGLRATLTPHRGSLSPSLLSENTPTASSSNRGSPAFRVLRPPARAGKPQSPTSRGFEDGNRKGASSPRCFVSPRARSVKIEPDPRPLAEESVRYIPTQVDPTCGVGYGEVPPPLAATTGEAAAVSPPPLHLPPASAAADSPLFALTRRRSAAPPPLPPPLGGGEGKGEAEGEGRGGGGEEGGKRRPQSCCACLAPSGVSPSPFAPSFQGGGGGRGFGYHPQQIGRIRLVRPLPRPPAAELMVTTPASRGCSKGANTTTRTNATFHLNPTFNLNSTLETGKAMGANLAITPRRGERGGAVDVAAVECARLRQRIARRRAVLLGGLGAWYEAVPDPTPSMRIGGEQR